MIKNSDGRIKEILIELKRLNKKANEFMFQRGNSWKPKYNSLWNTPIWKKAKKLLIEYFKLEKQERCPVCNKYLNFNKCTLHHLNYDHGEYFLPKYIALIHPWCNKKVHPKK